MPHELVRITETIAVQHLTLAGKTDRVLHAGATRQTPLLQCFQIFDKAEGTCPRELTDEGLRRQAYLEGLCLNSRMIEIDRKYESRRHRWIESSKSIAV